MTTLKKSPVPALAKTPEHMGFNPWNETTHQQQNEDTATELQDNRLAQNSYQDQVHEPYNSRDGPVHSKCVGTTKGPSQDSTNVISQMEPPSQRQGQEGPGMDIPINVGLAPGCSGGRATFNPHLGQHQSVYISIILNKKREHSKLDTEIKILF